MQSSDAESLPANAIISISQPVQSKSAANRIPSLRGPFGFLNLALSPFQSLFGPLFSRQRSSARIGSSTQSSAPSVYSTPVLVTTYSGPRVLPNMPRSSSSTTPAPALPPASAFTFSHILLAIDDQIEPAINGLSALCARSRLSLASEHESHLPPQGEILDADSTLPMMGGPVLPPGQYGRTRSLWVRTTGLGGGDTRDRGTALSVVLEADSSGSRSSASATASEAGTLRSALGSLREVLNKGATSSPKPGKGKGRAIEGDEENQPYEDGKSGWAVKRRRISEESDDDADGIVVVGSPRSRVTVGTTRLVEPEEGGQGVAVQMGGSGWLGWSRGVGLGRQATVESTLRRVLNASSVSRAADVPVTSSNST